MLSALITHKACMLLEWSGEGFVSADINMVLFECPGGGGIIYIHDVEEYFCTVPPMNNLGSLYTVLLLFLFYGGIIYFCDGMVSWYLFVSIYLPLIILV